MDGSEVAAPEAGECAHAGAREGASAGEGELIADANANGGPAANVAPEHGGIRRVNFTAAANAVKMGVIFSGASAPGQGRAAAASTPSSSDGGDRRRSDAPPPSGAREVVVVVEDLASRGLPSGRPLCAFTHKVLMLLAERGIPYRLRTVDLEVKPRAPWFTALNPKETVPVVLHGDTVLADSDLVAPYLRYGYDAKVRKELRKQGEEVARATEQTNENGRGEGSHDGATVATKGDGGTGGSDSRRQARAAEEARDAAGLQAVDAFKPVLYNAISAALWQVETRLLRELGPCLERTARAGGLLPEASESRGNLRMGRGPFLLGAHEPGLRDVELAALVYRADVWYRMRFKSTVLPTDAEFERVDDASTAAARALREWFDAMRSRPSWTKVVCAPVAIADAYSRRVKARESGECELLGGMESIEVAYEKEAKLSEPSLRKRGSRKLATLGTKKATKLSTMAHMRSLASSQQTEATRETWAGRVGASRSHFYLLLSHYNNWYFLLLRSSVGSMLVVAMSVYLLTVLLCTALAVPLAQSGDIYGAELADDYYPSDFEVALWYVGTSVVSCGFGSVLPNTSLAWAFGTMLQLLGLLFNVILFALVLAKFEQSHNDLLFSDKALVMSREGMPVLCIRVGNLRQNLILSPEVTLMVMRGRNTPEGESFVRMEELATLKLPSITASVTIVHYIDSSSPLRKLALTSRMCKDAEPFQIVLHVKGYDTIYQKDIAASKKYRQADLRWGVRFANVMLNADGKMKVNFDRFNQTRPIKKERGGDRSDGSGSSRASSREAERRVGELVDADFSSHASMRALASRPHAHAGTDVDVLLALAQRPAPAGVGSGAAPALLAQWSGGGLGGHSDQTATAAMAELRTVCPTSRLLHIAARAMGLQYRLVPVDVSSKPAWLYAMRTDEARAGEALAATSTDPTLPALAIIGGDRSVVRDDGVWATPRGARASLEAAAAHDGRDHGGGRGIEKRVSTMRALAEALARSFPLEAEAAGLSAAPTGRARRALRSLPTGDELLKLAHQMACCRPFTIEADQAVREWMSALGAIGRGISAASGTDSASSIAGHAQGLSSGSPRSSTVPGVLAPNGAHEGDASTGSDAHRAFLCGALPGLLDYELACAMEYGDMVAAAWHGVSPTGEEDEERGGGGPGVRAARAYAMRMRATPEWDSTALAWDSAALHLVLGVGVGVVGDAHSAGQLVTQAAGAAWGVARKHPKSTMLHSGSSSWPHTFSRAQLVAPPASATIDFCV